MRNALFAAFVILFSAASALALSDKPYVTPGEIEPINLLGPPPAINSAEQQQDLAQVLAIQKSRTPALIERAETDGGAFGYAAILGARFTAANVPTAAAFIRKVSGETGGMVDRVKDCWQRPRPFVFSKDVLPPDTQAQSMMSKPDAPLSAAAPQGAGSPCKAPEKPAYSYSYPSGGANAGMTAAILLANMVPEKRAEIYARGWESGENRLILGVHFPSDIEGGRILAAAVIAVMMQNPAFKADLAAAKTEVRGALGLAP